MTAAVMATSTRRRHRGTHTGRLRPLEAHSASTSGRTQVRQFHDSHTPSRCPLAAHSPQATPWNRMSRGRREGVRARMKNRAPRTMPVGSGLR